MSILTKLPLTYYQQKDTLFLAKDLIGKVLCSYIEEQLTSGIICETEAYLGETDKASHAYGGKRTKRTESMYLMGGYTYVYLCYGVHKLFNIVTHESETPHAILIRGIIPLQGKESILARRNKARIDKNICIGPGKVSQALGIDLSNDRKPLDGESIWLEDHGINVIEKDLVIGPRVGIDYAEEDALLPYRFQYFNF